jgi:hypothetical protein
MPPKEESPLESLRDRVYRPEEEHVEVPAYSTQETPATYGWQSPPASPPKKRLPWTVWFLAGAGAFLLIAGALAAYFLLAGTRAISSERVTITMDAPVSIASGDTVALVITVHNGNPTTLTKASLFATFPDGTQTGDGSDTPLTQYNDVLGDIPAGGDVTRTVQVKLYGAEDQVLPIPIKTEYRTEGSNALFVSHKDLSITIATSPISLQVQTLSQSPSGQPLSLAVIVRSNAATPLAEVALAAQYPTGFSVKSTDPATAGTNYFSLGTLNPGDQKTIKISGTLVGQNADQRVFRFTAGSASVNGTNTLGSTFAQAAATVTITHPFLNVNLSLNRESADTVVALPGENIGGIISWENMLGTQLSNASVRIALSGNALDGGSVKGGTGFYRSQDSTIVFDSTTNSSLASLSAGDTGTGSFSFAVKSASALGGVKNPTIVLTVSTSGQQANQGSTPQTLGSTLTRTIKIGTQVSLTSSVSKVSGPVPPVSGSETVYAVALTAGNTVNSVGAAKVTATLPSYVRYVSSSDPGVTYNADTSTVTWTIGDVQPAGKAASSFQVAINPSASQSGTAPTLVSDQTFSGVDRFTQLQVSAIAPALTTQLPGSPSSGTVK